MARSHSGGLDCGSVASAKDDVSGPDSEHRPTDEQEREGELSVFYGRGSRVEEEAGVSGRWADLDIVNLVLAQAEEQFTRQCSLRRRGYDLEKIAERIAEIYGINVGKVFARGRQPQRVGARSLFCFWAVRQLGNSLASLVICLGMSPAGVGYAVQRGEGIAHENGYQLIL